MKLGHLHIGFKDLSGAIAWMEKVLEKKPAYQNQNMAVFAFEHVSLIFDRGQEDAAVTVAFDSSGCDEDFARLTAKGAKAIEKPSDQPWGVRAAYIQGPGRITLEIEQALR